MHSLHVSAVVVSCVLLTSCTNTDNPQLAMCQAVAKQLTSNTISSWDNSANSDSGTNRVVSVAFTNADDQAGSAECYYKTLEDGSIETAPLKVVLNGQPVGQKELISAGTKASGELLAGTYKNTVEKSRELATQAGEVATDVANKAKDAAIDAGKTLQQLQK